MAVVNQHCSKPLRWGYRTLWGH